MIRTKDINEKNTSHVSMNICSSTGTWLNGCVQPQHYYVHMELKDPDDKLVARIGLSYEQVARMLMSNGEVECTLHQYRGIDGKFVEEKVEPPKTVHERMKERLGETQSSLAKRMEDIRRDLYAMVNGDVPRNKGKIEEILDSVKVVQSHFEGSQVFVVKQAEEELAAMQNNAIGQIGIFLQSKFGLEAPDKDVLKQLLPISDEPLMITTDVKPVEDHYELKVREQKPVDDMTALQVADQLRKRLGQIERLIPKNVKDGDAKWPNLYVATASERHGQVSVLYVSYQGSHMLSIEDAKKYLKYLMSIKTVNEFKTHWEVLEGR